MSPHVLVVGGGVSGLAAAHRLRTRLGPGARITVVEASRALGGKLRSIELAGVTYDVGAEAFLARRPEATERIVELGLSHELVHPAIASSSVRAGGVTRPIPARTVLGVPAEPDTAAAVLSPAGLARLRAEAALPPVRWGDGDVAVGALLRERLGDEVVDRLVDPLLGGVYSGRADALGLRATVPALAAALDAGAGSVLAAAAAALPPAPAPGEPVPPVFGTLRGGLAALIPALALAARAELRLGLPVRALRRLPAGRWRVEIGAAAAPEAVDVDAVLLAVPAPALRRLLADLVPAAAAAAGIDLASSAVVALALPAAAVRADGGLPAGSGVLVASGEPCTVKAVTYSSAKWAHLARDDVVLVRASVGRYGDPGVLQRDDGELMAGVRADLAALTGLAVAPVESAVIRWGGGLPQYGVGHLNRVALIEREVGRLPGLVVAGAALHGVGIPACLATADVAVAGVVAHLGRTAQPGGVTMGPWPA